MEKSHFTRVEFYKFKAFDRFTLHLREFNILVGPNNSGKSTILAAFRILAAAMRRANAKSAQFVRGPNGDELGYPVDLEAISVAQENLFYDYDDSEPATVTFTLSNSNTMQLYFPEREVCYMFARSPSVDVHSPSVFKKQFSCPIGFVPILGPVEQFEQLYKPEAARLALFSYNAARNFRNIWYHFPERFDGFKALVRETWPGMDIEPPRVELSHNKPRLVMFCPEERMLREIAWSGFGFQVWCQMLTHLIQSSDDALFLIDEPDIYLHSDLQRQLLRLLKDLGPDILIATHSTEIITEAESDDIVIINKNQKRATRIKSPSQLATVFASLGSNLNPILTQLANTKRAVFVEGKDFQILSRLAHRLGYSGIGNKSEFAVVPIGGFNPDRVKSLKDGIETTLGLRIQAATVLEPVSKPRLGC